MKLKNRPNILTSISVTFLQYQLNIKHLYRNFWIRQTQENFKFDHKIYINFH